MKSSLDLDQEMFEPKLQCETACSEVYGKKEELIAMLQDLVKAL